ncbi:hypothetical protein IM817_11470 [Serratia marcescens]|uniref:hypothetical protein n=1 Tax=Serratia marcescens TaxID=615 RepID=UPI001C56FEBB|nr:hypothetical protein [Serratia marcescens]QXX98746.1 hypothetical protein IM817_11470 [Serratia marcescens]
MSATAIEYLPKVIDFASKYIPPLLVAAVTAYFSTRFALNKFYKEKWWEKRLEAFTEIINIAYRIKMTHSYFLDCEYKKMEDFQSRFKPHPKDIEDKLLAEYWLDLQELERVAQLADFTLTTNVKLILDNFVSARKRIMDDCYDDALSSLDASERDFELSEKLLNEIVSEAKTELKVH